MIHHPSSIILAQGMDNVPGDWIKNFLLTGAAIVAIVYYLKQIFFDGKKDIQVSPQPLTVEVVEALHDRFASKKEFDAHVGANSDRHKQLFELNEKNATECRAEDRAIRKDVDERFASIQRLLGRIEQKIDQHL